MAVSNGNQIIVDRDYVDNYAMKRFTEEKLIPKYFDTEEVSDLSIGMIGLTTEQITNFTEDNFNMASVLVRETFPNRAQIPESIYSHGAIFQITDVFSQAAACSFYLVLMEDEILEYATFPTGSRGVGYFYIDKNTQIIVEDIPFTFDYDIQIQIERRTDEDGEYDYVYSATYLMDDYRNSISNINVPYIRMRKTTDGYIALEVTMHQAIREVHYEEIINNSTINYPTIKINFDDKLAGFDVLYTDPDTGIKTQLAKKIIYSIPSKDPFCFYQMTDEGELNISFTSRDTYFQPKFNSELEIILYLTKGQDGNFQKYTGTNISIISTNEKYEYNGNYRMVTKTIGGSEGGADQLSLEALQNLSVEGYRTALSLTTEPDLQYFFKNYKYRYGNEILFIKRRNDVAERIFSAFLIMQKNDMIYKTNTKDIFMNLYEMAQTDGTNVFIIEPGKLFVYKEDSYDIDFYRDKEKNEQYYQEYLEAVQNGTANFNPNDKNPPAELISRPISFAEWKSLKGYNDQLSVFDFTEAELEEIEEKEKFLFLNPFLIRFIKQPNLVSLYLTYIDQDFPLDFIKHNTETIKQFIMYKINIKRLFTRDKKYTMTISLLPSSTTSEEMIKVVDDPYRLSENNLRIVVTVIYNNKETCFFEMTPTTINEDVVTFTSEFYSTDHITSDNKLRVLTDTLYRNPVDGTYYKLIDEDDHEFYNLYDKDGAIIEANVSADSIKPILAQTDSIFRSMKEEFHYGEYYRKNEDMSTSSIIMYDHYDSENNLIESVSEDKIRKYIRDDVYWYTGYTRYLMKSELDDTVYLEYQESDDSLTENRYKESDIQNMLEYEMIFPAPFKKDLLYKKHINSINMTNNEHIYIPMYDALLEVTTLYYDPKESLPATNKFEKFDPSFKGFRVANTYRTSSELVTFMKPLDNIRCILEFKDYLYQKDGKYLYDMFDLELSSVPLIYYKHIFDEEKFTYFLQQFFSHYNFIRSIGYDRLRNMTVIDTKFFNTYGKSRNFTISEEDEIIDTVNIEIEFDVWVVQGTDKINAEREIKNFIKTDVETINDEVSNNLYISNLIRKIESTFAYVDHLRFIRINDYPSQYQTVKNKTADITKLTKEELRKYVPEILVCDLNKITLNIFEIE